MLRNLVLAATLPLVLLTSGCASMFNDETVDVRVVTQPEGARIKYDGKTYITPSRIPIRRGDDNIRLSVEKDGFQVQNVFLKRVYDYMALAGNCVIPIVNLIMCPVGLYVDFSTHEGYTVEPEQVTVQLVPDRDQLHAMKVRNEESTLLKVETHFINKTWFPLGKREMTIACVDEALEGLSKATKFRFLSQDSTPPNDTRAGKIAFHIDLIESVQLVKVKLIIQTANNVTYIANAKQSLKGKSRTEIYQAFENVGVMAANDIVEQIQARAN